MQQSCHCPSLIFSEPRPCCVCCSQHCSCALPALPSRDLTEASSQEALRFGMPSTASLMGWLHVSVLGGTSFLCLHLQPKAVPACHVFAMAGPWDVLGAQCLQPGPCRLLCAGPREAVAALGKFHIAQPGSCVWAWWKQDLATAPGAPTLSVGLGSSVAELSMCDVCMCCKSTLNGRNAPIHGLFSLGNLGIFMVEQPRAVAFHCHWLLHCGVNSQLGQLQEVQMCTLWMIIKLLLNGCTCTLHPTLTSRAVFQTDPHLQLDLLKERVEGIGDLGDPARECVSSILCFQ